MPVRFLEHPRRRQVVGEMHLRRFPFFAPPARAIQLVRLVTEDERDEELAALARLPAAPADNPRHREVRCAPDLRLAWERHSEASTVTLMQTSAEADWSLPGGAALDWMEALPGGVIRATQMIVVDDEEAASPAVAAAGFRASQLISCHVAGGARLWSDFRIHDDGYGRLVVAANGLPAADLVRCVQRLQELGNYRNLALLGLPVAQEAWARLDGIERRLGDAGRKLTTRSARDDDLLATLTAETEELLALAAECDFRLNATAAYADIVADRLRELDVVAIAGFPSLLEFTARRFNPAVRTCAAFGLRLRTLNERAQQFTALLRTRVETNIENQNGMLLRSLDGSARRQLRLQHLVEELSPVVLTYYLVGLLGYSLKALEKSAAAPSATLVLGIATPLVAIVVFLALRTMKRRLFSEDDNTARDRA